MGIEEYKKARDKFVFKEEENSDDEEDDIEDIEDDEEDKDISLFNPK
jgi:hypothetical protein